MKKEEKNEIKIRTISKGHEIAIYLLSLVILILGLSYASVPLYQLFCQATGFGGTVQKLNTSLSDSNIKNSTPSLDAEDLRLKNLNKSLSGNIENKTNGNELLLQTNEIDNNTKYLTIHFNADISDNLPWNFKPTINKIKVYPGDTALTFYIAQNTSNNAISGISTYHVTPAKVGIYFNKIQCFCFEEQRLKAHETVEMPVLFFIDPDFKTDPKMKDVDSITLSYTFYKSEFGA